LIFQVLMLKMDIGNGQSIENLGIPKGKRIDAIFRTYSGKTYTMWKLLME
jgi:hypothetical protein